MFWVWVDGFNRGGLTVAGVTGVSVPYAHAWGLGRRPTSMPLNCGSHTLKLGSVADSPTMRIMDCVLSTRRRVRATMISMTEPRSS